MRGPGPAPTFPPDPMSDRSELPPDPSGPGPAGAESDDAVLVERARSGEVEAFEALARRHHDRVWRVVWRMVGDEAEEAVQQVFLTAQRTLASLPGEMDFSTWLLRIASSQAQGSVTRRRSARQRSSSDTPRGDLALAASGDSPHRPLRPEVTEALLRDCVERLHGDLRAVIAVQLEGAVYEQIAQVVAAPVWTVRSRIFRARQALASCVLEKRAGRG